VLIFALFANFEAKRPHEMDQKRFLETCLRIKCCNHQRLGTTKLLKSLYSIVHTVVSTKGGRANVFLKPANRKSPKNFGSANRKSTNRKSASCQICKSSEGTNFISPQTCGFATCEIYFRTAHLW